MNPPSPTDGSPQQLGQLRGLIAPLLLFSLVTNTAILVSPIFMMQVLDRVVPSGNFSTLILLLLIALAALALNGIVEFGRDLSLKRVARWSEALCTGPILSLPAHMQQDALSHMTRIRAFMSGGAAISLLNLVWMPLFLIALGLIHVSYVVLVAVLLGTILTVQSLRKHMTLHAGLQVQSCQSAERTLLKTLETLPNAGPVQPHISQNLSQHLLGLQNQRHRADHSSEQLVLASGSFLSTLRMAAQLLALSIGAYLVSQGTLSAGGMIAASLIVSKSISSFEMAIGAARDWPDVKAAFNALAEIPEARQPETEIAELDGSLRCEGLIYPRGGGAPPRLDRIAFKLNPGECLAVIGEAGSGKSTLLNALTGLDPAPIGGVFLDQSDVRHIGPTSRRSAIGILPQQSCMLPGTLAANIAGFDPEPNDKAIIAAAKKAKVHGLISSLPDGYQTDIGARPFLLTAGQKQHIALAAALYGKPKYLFMDEPNSLLDKNSERALCETLAALKEDGVTIVMVLHRAGVIGLADQVLVLERGRIADFGPRAQVLGRQNDGRRTIRLPLRQTSLQDLGDWITSQFTRASDAAFATKAVMLGTEMFLAANLNGPQDQAREVEVRFTFIDDTHCDLQIVEQGQTKADKLLARVKAAIASGDEEFGHFAEPEMPLLLAAKLAKKFDIRNANNLAQFSARLEHDSSEAAQRRTH